MDTTQVMDLVRDAVGVAIKLSAPMLLLSMLVGVVVAIFQAVTQIHEQSIGFALKLIVVIAVLLLAGGWMLDTLKDYTIQIFDLVAS
jgi:flagellar biosynthetic protein FliQ